MKDSTKKVVGLGLLTAVVVVLQALAVGIRFGVFNISLVLVPIIVGAALYGCWSGAWLGLVFGVVVLFTDAGVFLGINVFGTVVTCIAKGVLSGLAAGAVYRLLQRRNQLAAAIAAGICAPVVNTGVFLLGCRLFFYDAIRAWGEAAGFSNTGLYLIVGFVGVNFVVELGINLVLSSGITQIIKIGTKKGQ